MENEVYIENYFNQLEISEEEKNTFQNRIKTDVLFAEEVAYYLAQKAVLRELEAEERQKRFNNINHDSNSIPSSNKIWLKYIGVALAACLVISFGYFWLNDKNADVPTLMKDEDSTQIHKDSSHKKAIDSLQKQSIDKFTH